jgi:hypothetical protein
LGKPQEGSRSSFDDALSDEPTPQAIPVLLVEDDAPTSWRLQDALVKAQVFALGLLASLSS